MEIRNASRSDARALAELINLAGEGIPQTLWRGVAAEGEPPLDVGAKRAARADGNFSYRNARICVEGDALLGMLLSYRLPDPCEIGDLSGLPEVVRPLLALEARAPGSWYVNAVATYESCRGRGVARTLMADAEERARACGCGVLSLIVASGNATAKRLYERLGYAVAGSLPLVPWPGGPQGGDWLLMTKRVEST